MSKNVHREDRGPRRTESWDTLNTNILGRRGVSNKEGRRGTPISLVCSTAAWGLLSVPSQDLCPSSFGLECSFSMNGWCLPIKGYQLQEALLIMLAKVSTSNHSLSLCYWPSLFLQRTSTDYKSFNTSVYVFIIWSSCHPSKIKPHEARTQTVFSLHRIYRRKGYARPWGGLVKRRNGVLAGHLQHIGTQTGIGAGTGCQHPWMPEAVGRTIWM